MESSELFNETLENELEIIERANNLTERVKAFPNEVESYDALLLTLRDGLKLWEECETKLRALEKESNDGTEKAVYVREINQAHEKRDEYDKRAQEYITLKLQNTSRSHKLLSSIGNAGEKMQSAGKSMQATGKKTTSGCTVPIIIAILLLLLLLIL